MTFHKSIPERPHGGTPPSWASTSVAAPPARSDPSGARVPPFARAPESRPAFHLAAGWRGVVDRRRVAAGRPISRRDPGELPDHDAEAGTGAAARRARPAPVPARRRPRRQPRRHRRFATRALPSQPVAIRPPDQLSAAERRDIAAKLAPLLQLSAADILAKLATARQFVYLARRVPSSVAHQLDALRLPGIGKVAETQRSYVDGGVAGTSLAANLLGFANDEGQGNYGVEGFYNTTLAGQPGFEATVRDLANRPIVLSDRQRRDPVNGMTLQLSLDSTIQVVAERALADGVRNYQAETGSLTILH